MLIAVLKEDHEVTGDDGCSASWTAGSELLIGPDASLDYVRKGVIVLDRGSGSPSRDSNIDPLVLHRFVRFKVPNRRGYAAQDLGLNNGSLRV